MARTTIPVDIIPANGGQVTLTGVPSDPANGLQFANNGNVILVFENNSAGAVTATIASVVDQFGRLGDRTVTVPPLAGGFSGKAVAGPFPPSLWNQGAGAFTNVDSAALATVLKVSAAQFQRAA